MLIPQSSLSDIIADFSTKMNFLVTEIICEFKEITNNPGACPKSLSWLNDRSTFHLPKLGCFAREGTV